MPRISGTDLRINGEFFKSFPENDFYLIGENATIMNRYQTIIPHNNYTVRLSKVSYRIDYLVATTHCKKSDPKMSYIAHWDDNMQNNNVRNLSFVFTSKSKELMLAKKKKYSNDGETNGYYIFVKMADEEYRIYNSQTSKYSTVERVPDDKNRFEVFKGYDNEILKKAENKKPITNADYDKVLELYHDDFVIWIEELKHNDILKIHYDKYKTHNYAVSATFKRLCKGKYEHFDTITCKEVFWYRECYDAGQIWCIPTFDETKQKYVPIEKHNCHAYDFSLNYPNILGSKKFQIPLKEGTFCKLDKTPKKFKYGIYKVRSIHCTVDSGDILELEKTKDVSISATGYYTHYTLNYIKKHYSQYDIYLANDCDENALIYNKEDLVNGCDIFSEWLEKLMELRSIYPKNKLLKHLATSLWGQLTRFMRKYITDEEFDDHSIGFTLENAKADYILYSQMDKKDGSTIYEIISREQPMAMQFRILPFLPSYARNQIGRVIRLNYDAVIRVHTDGVIFEDYEIPEKKLKKFNHLHSEDKYNGSLLITHVNNIVLL